MTWKLRIFNSGSLVLKILNYFEIAGFRLPVNEQVSFGTINTNENHVIPVFQFTAGFAAAGY
jgi:hypothetical protein